MKRRARKLFFVTLSVLLVFVLIGASGSSAKGKNDNKGKEDDSHSSVPVRVAKLETIVTGLNQTMSAMQQTIGSQKNEITSLKTDVASLNTVIQSLKTEVESLQTNFSSVTIDVASVKTDITSVKTDMASLFSHTQQMETRLEKLENNVPPQPGIGHTVTGVMQDANGVPFFSGFVLVDQAGKWISRNSENLTTGAFTFTNIPDGAYTLKYYTDSYIIDSPKQITVAGADITGIVIKLAVPTYMVTGRATDAIGNPISGQITVKDSTGNQSGYWPPVSADGTFFLRLAPGTYTIEIGDFHTPTATANIRVTDHDVSGLTISPQQPNSKNISFTQDIKSPDLHIQSLSGINDQSGNISITMKYTSGEIRDFAFFNPPNGDKVKLIFNEKLDIIQDGQVTFKVPIADIQKMDQITMCFYNPTFDQNFIYVNPTDFASLMQ